MLRIISNAGNHASRIAIVSGNERYSYAALLASSKQFACALLDGSSDLHQAHVAFMVEPGFDYVKV